MTKNTINPAWLHIIGVSSVLLALLSGLVHSLFRGWGDPMLCRALLNDGSWLDSDHQKWQPNGCMLYSYLEVEAATCLGSKEIFFIGDSVVRKLFFQTAKLLDASQPSGPLDTTKKHLNHSLSTTYGTNLTFIWDPFLNTSYTESILTEANPTKVVQGIGSLSPPYSMLVMGSGLWYLRYADTSGGITSWEGNMERIFNTLVTRTKLADKIVILPVEQIVPEKLSADRAASIHLQSIDAMNSDLFHRINPPPELLGPSNSPAQIGRDISLPLVFNKMLDASLTQDGLHYSDELITTQAQILLNLRCNNALPKVFPMNKTCCNRYPIPSLFQSIFIAVVALTGPYLSYKVFKSGSGLTDFFHDTDSVSVLTISVSVALIFLADRTPFWMKEHKVFDPWTFTFLCSVSLATGFATMKRGDTNGGFLNRDQTDEWKGWMQIIILIYHYVHASQVSGIYNPVRALVASYLFMTGYGHTTFYIRKADFGLRRILQVLVRLNLFTILLAYTMNTSYISYYFTPLVSMWYIVIYMTMVIGARFNDRTPLLVIKIVLAGALMKWFMNEGWLLEKLFELLHRFCAIHWSAREWAFRVNLDIAIVFLGMLAAVAAIKIRENRLADDPRWPTISKAAIVISGLVICWYFVFAFYQESKFAYNGWHPYVSFLPVLAFIVLRNSNTLLRSSSSQAFSFVGKSSLELFIVQYHFWLAADSKGVLLVIPGTHWRPVNFVISTIMFLYLCDRVSYASGELTKSICRIRARELPLSVIATPTMSHGRVRIPDNSGSEEQGDLQTSLPMKPNTSLCPLNWANKLTLRLHHYSESFREDNSWLWHCNNKIFLCVIVLWLLNLFWDYT